MSAVAVIGQDGLMDSSAGPRAGGPRPRRSFTAREKLAHLAAYEAACADGAGGGAYLRSEGLYSSQVTEWRRLRDAGVLEGKGAGREGRATVAGTGRDRQADPRARPDQASSGENRSGA